MTAEIIRGMPEQVYRDRQEISQSDLKRFLLPTPAHAKHAAEKEQEEKSHLLVGTCLHALVLEGRREFVACPEVDGRTTAGKAEKARFLAENQGKIILSSKEAEAVEGMAAGVLRNRGAALLLEAAADRELSIFWAGYKARLDFATPIGAGDLKSTRDASPKSFEKSLLDFGYHIQGAHYLEAAAAAGLCADDFYIIAVENVAPWECAVYKLAHEALEVGRYELHRLRELARRCKETGEYPGYSHEPQELSLPAWIMRQYAEE